MNQQTLRYYEQRGLLAEPPRSPGGHRLYSDDAVTVLRVIKAAQRLGFTLEEIAELLEYGKHRHGRADAGLHERARAKLTEFEARIGDIVVIRDNLQSALAMGCDDLVACAQSDCGPLPFTGLAKDGHHRRTWWHPGDWAFTTGSATSDRCPSSAPSEG